MQIQQKTSPESGEITIDTLRYEATLTPESPIALAEDLATLHPTAWGLLITTPQRTLSLPWPVVRQLAAALPQLLRLPPMSS